MILLYYMKYQYQRRGVIIFEKQRYVLTSIIVWVKMVRLSVITARPQLCIIHATIAKQSTYIFSSNTETVTVFLYYTNLLLIITPYRLRALSSA